MALKLNIRETTFKFKDKKYRALFERYPVYKKGFDDSVRANLVKHKTVISVREIIDGEDAVLAVGFYNEKTRRCGEIKYWTGNVKTHGKIVTKAASLINEATQCDDTFFEDEKMCCDGIVLCDICKAIDASEQRAETKEEQNARTDIGRSTRTRGWLL